MSTATTTAAPKALNVGIEYNEYTCPNCGGEMLTSKTLNYRTFMQTSCCTECGYEEL